MKIDWKNNVTGGLNRNTWQYTKDHYRFIITQIRDRIYWLHLNENYIGSFSTLKKSQKIVELILKG